MNKSQVIEFIIEVVVTDRFYCTFKLDSDDVLAYRSVLRGGVGGPHAARQVQFIDVWHQIWKLREIDFWMKNIGLGGFIC